MVEPRVWVEHTPLDFKSNTTQLSDTDKYVFLHKARKTVITQRLLKYCSLTLPGHRLTAASSAPLVLVGLRWWLFSLFSMLNQPWTRHWERALQLAVQFSKSLHKKRNGRQRHVHLFMRHILWWENSKTAFVTVCMYAFFSDLPSWMMNTDYWHLLVHTAGLSSL